MKTNNIGKVSIAASKRKRARFNLSHDVNTTCGFGEVQPLMCRHMVPNSKLVVDPKQLIRLAPMVAPTFGRMRYQSFASFIPFSDLSENFAAMMAQTSVSRGGKTFIPKRVPSMELCNLSALCLVGAQITIYSRMEYGSASNVYNSLPVSQWDLSAGSIKYPAFGYASPLASHFVAQGTTSSLPPGAFLDVFGFDNVACGWLELGWLLNGPNAFRAKGSVSGNANANKLFIPVTNPTIASFFDYQPDNESSVLMKSNHYPFAPVSLDGADYLISHEVSYLESTSSTATTPSRVIFAIKLSSFGKRIRKILQGLGYQINFGSSEQVSIYPLFAFYKAYFDSFGLTLFQNWQSTNASKLLTWFDYENKFADVVSTSSRGDWSDNYLDAAFWRSSESASNANPITDDTITRILWGFFVDLGNTFATESQDYVSAHIASTAVSPKLGLSSEFIDVDSLGAKITEVDSSAGSSNEPVNSHAYINQMFHGNLDSEYLKKLYKWTNINTIAGRRIAELLRAQGLGAYVDECRSNFIGTYNLPLDINDVTSTADTQTVADDSGAVLGQYAGKSVSFGKGRKWSWETSEDGYFVVLSVLMPQSGYCQAVDGSLFCLDKLDYYNPEFDGLGMEATRRLQIVGTSNCVSTADDGGQSANYGVFDKWAKNFGFIPRYSSLKVANNVMNGDFNLRSTRTKFLPYTMDKFIDIDSQQVIAIETMKQNSQDVNVYKIGEGLALSDLPTANPVWRFVARYPWLENYNRIFVDVGSNQMQYLGELNGGIYGSSAWFDLCSQQEDNFLVHNVLNVQYYAPMLPVEDSFETLQEGNEGKANTGMTKA